MQKQEEFYFHCIEVPPFDNNVMATKRTAKKSGGGKTGCLGDMADPLQGLLIIAWRGEDSGRNPALIRERY